MGKRITQLDEMTTIANADLLYGVDVDDLTHSPDGTSVKFKKSNLLKDANITSGTIGSGTNVVEVLKKVYPVGSIYTNATDSTNPATLFGFGTWEAFGAGRVLVGKASSGTFATAGATMGAETHTLSSGEMPTHSHEMYGTKNFVEYSSTPYPSTSLVLNEGAVVKVYWNSGGATNFKTWKTGNTGGGGSHNNIQPSIVVYMWKRTA